MRGARSSIRDAYEQRFSGADGREVTVHRVINVMEKRAPMPRDYDRGFNDEQWYDGPRNYLDARDCYAEDSYPHSDYRYLNDDPGFRRNYSPPRHEGSYSKPSYNRQDLRHQINSRNRGRGGPHFRSRGRGSGPRQSSAPERKSKHSHPDDRNDYRVSPPVVVKRDHSPGNREAQPSVRSGSHTSSKSFSPNRDEGSTRQQAQKKDEPGAPRSHTPSSPEEAPHSSGSSKEKTPASVVETEEVVAASMEPKVTPEEDFKARRLEAIKAKSLEIEKHYRQDCETFRTVVKMLVAKEPSLENLLQAPLDKNLVELKQRCLDDLRHFVKELDEVIAQGGGEPGHDSPHSSFTTQFRTEEDFPRPRSTNPSSTDGKQEGRRPPANTGYPSQAAQAGNQGGGEQTGKTEDSTPLPEISEPGSQENLSIPPEDSYSEPMELQSDNTPAPTQQDPIESPQRRLQLYGHDGEKFSNSQLSNPQVWRSITYVRLGWTPERLPFFQPGEQYWELKANSTVVSASTPPYKGGRKREKVACGVTCYNHVEGPWCEIQSENGTRICILAAPPTSARIPPLLGQ